MNYAQRLQEFLESRKQSTAPALAPSESRMLRSLKAAGERAIKGRDISECVFDVQVRNGKTFLRMIMEGRHSVSVGHQVARRFEGNSELEFADVVKTKTGAKLVMRMVTENAASSAAAAQKLVDKLVADGHKATIHKDYSGRGMMGAKTMAVNVNTTDRGLINQIASGEYMEDGEGWRMDQTDIGVVFYKAPGEKRGFLYW